MRAWTAAHHVLSEGSSRLLALHRMYRAIVLFEAHFKRNYLHINDAVDGFIFAIENQNLKGDCYNLGYSEANLSKLELCNLIKKYIPQFVYHCSEIGEDPDKRNYVISNEKIMNLLLKPSQNKKVKNHLLKSRIDK